MDKTFNIYYDKVNIISTRIESTNNEESIRDINIVYTLFARGYGKMIKEITTKFLLSGTIKGGTVDKFIEDVTEISALEKQLSEIKIRDDLTTNNKIVSTIREKYKTFTERWDRYFEGELSWRESE